MAEIKGGPPPTHAMRSIHLAGSADAVALLSQVGVDPYGIEAMLPKMRHLNILIEGLECKVANIVKQEMLAVGGDAAVARGSVACAVVRTDALLMGTVKQLERFAEKISCQPFGLRGIAARLNEVLVHVAAGSVRLRTSQREMILGEKTCLMGILNVTPDSFSDGGRYFPLDRAVARGVRLVQEGASILDIGGESTRPGAEPVSLEEERARVIPVIERLAREIDIPISIDTTKADVAREALAAGAEIINDISAMSFDERMARTAADSGAAVVLQHMRGRPKDMQIGDLTYRSVQGDVIGYLQEKISQAVQSGIGWENIVVDPGLGFGKKSADSLKLLKYLPEFKSLGRPILVGPSRKAFTDSGAWTGGEISEPRQRIEGTAAAVVVAIMNGAHIVRVHDVAVMKKVAALTDAILQS